MSDEQVYYDYLTKWPHSLTRMYIDTENEYMMGYLITGMRKALKDNKPLDDSIFNLPDGIDI